MGWLGSRTGEHAMALQGLEAIQRALPGYTHVGTLEGGVMDRSGNAHDVYIFQSGTTLTAVRDDGYQYNRELSGDYARRAGVSVSAPVSEFRAEARQEAAPPAEQPAAVTAPPVVMAPVTRPAAATERVAAQTTTEGAQLVVWVFDTVVEPTRGAFGIYTPGMYSDTNAHSETYYIDLNRLSASERREYEEMRRHFASRNTAFNPEDMTQTDMQRRLNAFYTAVGTRGAWIEPGATTQGCAFTFRQHAQGVDITADVTESYTFRVDLNALSESQRAELNSLLGQFERNPYNPTNLEMMERFLRSIPSEAVLQRPTLA